jgi:hypothetical protein
LASAAAGSYLLAIDIGTDFLSCKNSRKKFGGGSRKGKKKVDWGIDSCGGFNDDS